MTPADPSPIRVVIADDHALYRQSLQLVISLDGDIDVVGLASDGQEALDQVLEHHPDVVVLDLQMPRLSGVEAIHAIMRSAPDTRILMLTMSEEPSGAVAALIAGAAGYVTKDATGEQVADAIRTVHHGSSQLAPSAAATLLDRLIRDDDRGDIGPDRRLDHRILQLLAGGDGPAEVASALNMSEDEVNVRMTRMLLSLRTASAGRT